MSTNTSKETGCSVGHFQWILIPLSSMWPGLEYNFYRRLFQQREHQEYLRGRPFSLSLVFPLGIKTSYTSSQYINPSEKPLLCCVTFTCASFSWSPRLLLHNRLCHRAMRNVQYNTVNWGWYWFWNNRCPNTCVSGL